MKQTTRQAIVLFTISALCFISSCNIFESETTEISNSLEPVEEVEPVTGAQNTTMTVNKSDQYYLSLEFSNIEPNEIIDNSEREGWCIDWQMPIDGSNGTYNDVKLYSTYLVEKWKSVNYLLNIKEALRENDPELTYREIQAAIWSLRANPEFNLDEVAVEDLPDNMKANGQPLFSEEKVREILKKVDEEYQNFDFEASTKFAVIAETPVDVQTVITVVETN